MTLVKLTEQLAAVCPIHGVNSDKVISFKDEATEAQRAAAQAIADAFDLNAPVDQRPIATEEFKVKRELIVGRVVQLAVAMQHDGDDAFASALLALRKKIIPLDAHPLVLAAPDHDLEALRAAYVQAYKQETAAALATAPDQAATLRWKAEIDKVFK